MVGKRIQRPHLLKHNEIISKLTGNFMQRIAVWFFAFFMVLGTGLDQAEAKRLGGGKSMGTYSKSTTTSPTSSNYTQPSKTGTTTAAAGARSSKMGFLGPLAGLAAGGLLAAMFFGDGFEGFQMFDFILIALVAFIIFKLIARKRQAAPAVAAPQSMGYQKEAFGQNQERSFDTNLMGGGAVVQPQVPDWFDAVGFVERAKGHFVHLQKAWDSNDLAEIQDFVTPELYNLLSQERKALDEEPNTDVVSLEARLGGISQQGSLAEASVVFSGQIRENSSVPTDFSETWHLVRDMRQENASWYLQGIQQN